MRAIDLMVVDDFKKWRDTLKLMLGAMGHRVVDEADNALDAIAKAGQLLPEIVLLDIGLPLLNGIEAARRIREASPASKIIFVTQEQDHDIKAAALASGGDGYVLKSDVIRQLKPALEAVIAISLPRDGRNSAQFVVPVPPDRMPNAHSVR